MWKRTFSLKLFCSRKKLKKGRAERQRCFSKQVWRRIWAAKSKRIYNLLQSRYASYLKTKLKHVTIEICKNLLQSIPGFRAVSIRIQFVCWLARLWNFCGDSSTYKTGPLMLALFVVFPVFTKSTNSKCCTSARFSKFWVFTYVRYWKNCRKGSRMESTCSLKSQFSNWVDVPRFCCYQ